MEREKELERMRREEADRKVEHVRKEAADALAAQEAEYAEQMEREKEMERVRKAKMDQEVRDLRKQAADALAAQEVEHAAQAAQEAEQMQSMAREKDAERSLREEAERELERMKHEAEAALVAQEEELRNSYAQELERARAQEQAEALAEARRETGAADQSRNRAADNAVESRPAQPQGEPAQEAELFLRVTLEGQLEAYGHAAQRSVLGDLARGIEVPAEKVAQVGVRAGSVVVTFTARMPAAGLSLKASQAQRLVEGRLGGMRVMDMCTSEALDTLEEAPLAHSQHGAASYPSQAAASQLAQATQAYEVAAQSQDPAVQAAAAAGLAMAQEAYADAKNAKQGSKAGEDVGPGQHPDDIQEALDEARAALGKARAWAEVEQGQARQQTGPASPGVPQGAWQSGATGNGARDRVSDQPQQSVWGQPASMDDMLGQQGPDGGSPEEVSPVTQMLYTVAAVHGAEVCSVARVAAH